MKIVVATTVEDGYIETNLYRDEETAQADFRSAYQARLLKDGYTDGDLTDFEDFRDALADNNGIDIRVELFTVNPKTLKGLI